MINDQIPTQEKPPRERRDWPHLFKWIILIFLVLLLVTEMWAGEFAQIREMQGPGCLVLLLKLILIALVIWLMRLQRRPTLIAEVTDPVGCAATEYDIDLDQIVIVVRGSAAGSAFASYTLSVERAGVVQPFPISYPGGGPSGVVPVINGELGRIDVSLCEPGMSYTVILTVTSIAAATATDSSNFDIQDRVAYITDIGAVPARVVGPHPSDPTEFLKLIKLDPDPPLPDDPSPETSVGGRISVEGSADVYCCGEEMKEYGLAYRDVPFGSDPWEADAGGAWTDVMTPLPFGVFDPVHPRRYVAMGGWFDNFVRNGELTRKWATVKKVVGINISPPPLLIKQDRQVTVEEDWNTGSLNGYYTVRLHLEHDVIVGPPAPSTLYDAATVWLDNRTIEVLISGFSVGGVDLEACGELRLSQFVVGGSKVNIDINGRAWDPIISDTYPAVAPNDNFHSYRLHFKKDGAVAWLPIPVAAPNTPVPPDRQTTLPAAPNDVGVLAPWDIIGALDAGPKPAGGVPPAPYPKIYRSDNCAYLIKLYARDATRLSDSGEPHDDDFYWPFCVVNDLPADDPFPVP